MDFKKSSKGITLIALVITIIVLLILAGVSLNLIAGSNGIMKKANNAAIETEKASARELLDLKLLDADMYFYEEKARKATFIEVVKELAESEEFTITAIELGQVSSLANNVTLPEDLSKISSICVCSNDDMDTVFKIAKDRTITVVGDAESEEKPEVPGKLEVGTIVNYEPSGTYTEWTAEHSGYDKDYVLASGSLYTNSNTQTDMTISSWKVFKTEDETGKVQLVPASLTPNAVGLKGANGYNNGVKLLNDACSSLYGKEGVTARHINIEDIESVLEYDKNSYVSNQGKKKYEEQCKEPFVAEKYPAIYPSEKKSVIEGIETEGTLGLSEPASDWVIGEVTGEIKIQPSQTYYHLFEDEFGPSLKDGYYDMFIRQSEDIVKYWIASRCVFLYGDSRCSFIMRVSVEDRLGGDEIYFSDNEMDRGYERLMFPILSVDASLIEIDENKGFIIK